MAQNSLKDRVAHQTQALSQRPVETPDRTIRTYLDRMKGEIALALPAHLTTDRLARVALTEIRRNPRLLNASIESLMAAVMLSAQLGLEPGPLGHCYFVPFRNGKTGTYEVSFIIGYKGYLELVRRSGQVRHLAARVVYEHDRFEFEYGFEDRLTHVPALRDRGQPVYVYMVATETDGTRHLEVMTVEEVEAIRRRSKSPDDGPWVTDWAEMARKTVVRRGVKYLPLSVEIQRALTADETVRVRVAPDMLSLPDVAAETPGDADGLMVLSEPEAAASPDSAPTGDAAPTAATEAAPAEPEADPAPVQQERLLSTTPP
jgi:recombination protein RecT